MSVSGPVARPEMGRKTPNFTDKLSSIILKAVYHIELVRVMKAAPTP
jgi:hypothetical protein